MEENNIETVYYLYKITLLKGSLSNYYYLGKRTFHLPKYLRNKDNIYEYLKLNPNADSYCGSGKIIKCYFKKYGKEYKDTYDKEIIKFCNSSEENKEEEELLVGDLYKSDELCLNLIKGGSFNPILTGNKNPSYKKPKSAETREKLSIALKEYYKTHTQKWTGKIKRTPELKKKISESLKKYYKTHAHPNLGKHHTEATKKLLSDKQKELFKSDEYRNKIIKTRTEHLKNNPYYYSRSNPISAETKKKLSNKLKGTPNIKNKDKNNGMYNKIPSNAKSVLQFDKNGNFIKEWKSAAEASRELHISNITVVCNGKRKFAGGYIWKYGVNNYSSKAKAVLQYSLSGEFIAEYKSCWQAAKELNYDSSSIYKVCSGKGYTYKNFVWKFKSN